MTLNLFQSIDIRVVFGNVNAKNEFDSFKALMQRSIEISTGNKVTIEASSYLELFYNEKKDSTYFGKEVILLLDEIDALDSWSSDQKEKFLIALREIKQFKKNPAYCLRSVMGITNAVGKSLSTKVGNSPFNVGSSEVTSPYFTKEEFLELYKQYEDQEGIEIPKEIKDDIFEQTAGAQGLSAMFGEKFNAYRMELGYVPTFNEWFSFSRSFNFLKWFETKANFKKMMSLIDNDPYCVRTLVEKIIFGLSPTATIPESLIRANIMKCDGDFSNPFVLKFITYKLNDIPSRKEAYCIPMRNGQIDFLQLIYNSIPYMNRLAIVGAPKMSTNYCLNNSKKFLGPKEEVYATTFLLALQSLLRNLNVTKYCPQYPAAGQSCHMVLEIEDNKIVVEHGANLKVEQNSQHRNSVYYHVKKQAKQYHTILSATQSWVINWTTVRNGEAANERKYFFPESSIVNTVDIYHDHIFTNIIVETKDCSKIIERKLPDLNKIAKRKSPFKKRVNQDLQFIYPEGITLSLGDAIRFELWITIGKENAGRQCVWCQLFRYKHRCRFSYNNIISCCYFACQND